MRTHLRLITAELAVAVCKPFKTNGELDIARAYNVLNLELGKFGVKAQFLHNTRVFTRRQTRIILRLCTGNDHLARRKDEGSSLRITDTHNDGRKTLDHAKIEQFGIAINR